MEYIAGIDEAGRGCIAGPVVAAAVILPKKYTLPFLTDSKKLNSKKREILALLIKEQASSFAIGISLSHTVDSINILQATLHAMADAASKLSIKADILHIDGNTVIPEHILSIYSLSLHQISYIKGDETHPHISAASILAKTYRDEYMYALSHKYPEYNFAKHKGYPTTEHYKAIEKYGIIEEHRKTFAGVVCQNQQKKLEIEENSKPFYF